jgi:hypothetical protein
MIAACAVALSGTALACSLPPYTTPAQNVTVKYSMFVPPVAQGIPIPTGLPAFADRQAPATTFPLPKEAQTFNLSSVTLNLSMQNTGPLPLRIKIYLSRESVDPYSTAPLGGDQPEIELPAKGPVVAKSLPIDPALMKEQKLKLGYTFGSPGTNQTVTFQESDSVLVSYSVTAQAKLF